VWLEVTTLLIPGHNDGEAEIDRLTDWFARHLGPDVPLHFSAFHPDFKMMQLPRTPIETLRRARAIARAKGLRHVYIGNVRDPEAEATYCPGCGARVIARDGYAVTDWRLDAGNCVGCGHAIAGVFEGRPGGWGARRVPLRVV
jgi:pyruvate formate lyase activating enzyme